jgi:hypothetical protein
MAPEGFTGLREIFEGKDGISKMYRAKRPLRLKERLEIR